MDVAKRLADWRDQPPEQWFTAINRYLPPGVTALLVIAIAYQLSTLTWTVVPGLAPAAAPAPRAPPTTARGAGVGLGALASSHLFGEAAEQAAPTPVAVIDAPETTLSLILKGIVATIDRHERQRNHLQQSRRGQERTRSATRSTARTAPRCIPSMPIACCSTATAASRRCAFPKELSASSAPMARPSPLPQAQPQNTGTLREAIVANASRIGDVMRVAPHVQEGQVVGFRLTPGRDRAAFEALGLQSGDVVTDINGTVLDDPSQGLQVVQALGESTTANVTVLRDGVPQVLVIDTTQVQSLQENRE